tara:strand:+ start:7528 stop:7758 length:231 start_codon:yes stop_codon:yes gene_type:complete
MKTQFKDLLASDVKTPFAVNSIIHDIGKMAEIIEDLARDKMTKEGEFAQVSCKNVADWMKDIQDKAQNVLDIQLEK